MIFSHSRLNTYENCPRKFAFQYIEKPDIEKRDSIEAFMGSCVHKVLEHLYASVQMQRVPKWEETRDFYEDYWTKNLKPDVLIVRTEFTADDYRNVGRRCLQDYFVKQYPFINGRVLGLEEKIWVDLDGSGKYKLQGFIDRLDQLDDGTIEIHDYKTSRRLPTQEEIDAERQLALYQIAVQERWRDIPGVRLVWHYLRANKALISVRSSESLQQLKTETIHLIDTIDAAIVRNDFPPHETQLCDWCEFQSICPTKRHAVAVAAMTPEQYSADQGVQLVDQFVAAKSRVDDAQQELQFARDQIVEFSKRTTLVRLQGHSASVRVYQRLEQTVPNADDPNRKVLEAVVRASGQWDKVSDLSRSKLPKAIQGDLFDPATKQRIAGLLVQRESVTVSTSKLTSENTDDGPDFR
jgi:putative RecB family exonuclease